MSLLSVLKGKGKSGFGYGSTAEEVTAGVSLAGKNVLITGCNSGLGLETMRVLAMRGAHILGLARSVQKAQEAAASVNASADSFACELAEPQSITAAVSEIKKLGKQIDVLVCNAGIMALPRLEKQYGYEAQFFTNHIGHFILVTGLLSTLAPAARVVIVTSSAHVAAPPEGIRFEDLGGDKLYIPWLHYGQSKMANLLFAKELARKFQGSGRTANAVHPGVIFTNLGRHMSPIVQGLSAIAKPLFLKSVGEGAATQCYVASHPALAGVSGEYFADCNVAMPRPDANDRNLAERLWKVSEEIAAKVTA